MGASAPAGSWSGAFAVGAGNGPTMKATTASAIQQSTTLIR